MKTVVLLYRAATATLAIAVSAIRAAGVQNTMTPTSQPATSAASANRLIRATSPYLLQHAHNPVDWYEWGPEAIDKARAENKPIFLSIGYSACHWCHVMAHESFEDAAVAGVMNRLFVNIKVDREERPDLDEIYMQATMMFQNGQGGWPMSVWLTPDLTPFYAGTYFPPTSRWGRPGFVELCERIGELWATKRGDLEKSARQAAAALADHFHPDAGAAAPLSLATIDQNVALLARIFDRERGGMSGGGTNKFPPSMSMDLMLRFAHRRGHDDREASDAVGLVTLTLDRMSRGGIYDQLAGGICRYSTDVDWLVPHFEKMLYDQALVSRIYLDASLALREPRFGAVAADIFDYVLTDLQSPEGGFYSSRDADSDGQEGKYYVWTRPEILAALGTEDGELFCSSYDVTVAGNWADPHEPGVAKNILHTPRDLDTVAKLNRVTPDVLRARLNAARTKLREIRGRRTPPHRDEKVLAEWNGLMISTLARGGAAIGQPKYVEAAARAARSILEKQLKNGRLMRSYRDGRVLETAFLTDYAAMIDGLIELYEATFERRWLDRAVELNAALTAQFWDAEHGGYFFTGRDHERLIARTKDVRDSTVPSGNSVQLMNLLRLAVMLGDDDTGPPSGAASADRAPDGEFANQTSGESLRSMADKTMLAFAADVAARPGANERFLAAVDFAVRGPVEIAVVGDPALPATQALLAEVRRAYVPNRVLMLLNPARPADAPSSPLLKDRGLVDGQPTVYICHNCACEIPITDPAQLAARLAAQNTPR